jgi:hypothetical protein
MFVFQLRMTEVDETAVTVKPLKTGVEVAVMLNVADLVVSCVLVALTTIVPFEAGAVTRPACVMEPTLADQTTPVPNAPVPATVA